MVIRCCLFLCAVLGISSCGKSSGYAVSDTTKPYDFLYIGNYGSSTIAPFLLDSNGILTKAAATLATGTNTFNVVDIKVLSDSLLLFAVNKNSGNVSSYRMSSISAEIPASLTPIADPFSFSAGTGSSSITLLPSSDFAYVTNSSASGNNLTLFSLNPSTGVMTNIGTAAARTNPWASYFSATSNTLFIANRGTSDISTYSVNRATGLLTLINLSQATGANPQDLWVTPDGSFLYVLCNGGGSIYGYSIAANGTLSPLTPASITTGAGPTKLAANSTGDLLYVANSSADTISAFMIGSSGALTEVIGSPFPVPVGAGVYSIVVSPDNQYLVATGDTSGAAYVFSITSSNGALALVSTTVDVGTNPRSLVFVRQSRDE